MMRLWAQSSEWVRWLVSLGLTALVAYLTALGAIQVDIADIRAKEESHFGEVLRRLDVITADIRELRRAGP